VTRVIDVAVADALVHTSLALELILALAGGMARIALNTVLLANVCPCLALKWLWLGFVTRVTGHAGLQVLPRVVVALENERKGGVRSLHTARGALML